MESNSNQKRVIFDGKYQVCSSLKDFIEGKVEDDKLEFIPYQSDDFKLAAPNLEIVEAMLALYVITENGKRLRGARAIFEILSDIPGV